MFTYLRNSHYQYILCNLIINFHPCRGGWSGSRPSRSCKNVLRAVRTGAPICPGKGQICQNLAYRYHVITNDMV